MFSRLGVARDKILVGVGEIESSFYLALPPLINNLGFRQKFFWRYPPKRFRLFLLDDW